MPSAHDLAEKHSSEEEEEDGGRSLGSMSGWGWRGGLFCCLGIGGGWAAEGEKERG